MTDITELAQRMKAAAEKATPGEWWADEVKNEGCYGPGDDCVEGFTSYAIYGSDGQTLFDSLNSDAACISEEYDGEGHVAWDETAQRNAEFIALANPANVRALVEALEKAQAENTAGVAGMAESYETTISMLRSRIAELEAQNEYIRKRYQQLDLLIGKNILVMQAAIIEWQATGDAKNGLAWIYNTLFGPGELPDEAEKDAQAYFDRKYAPLDEELMALHKWFWEQSEAERAAAGIKVEAE
ncbi:ead/Ea22-like family protein [Klebsiella quasipneumoniae]|uniref:ead/Ea22-like family protein n=1 Tax=Klebsiella quasipneumoniae TaxID=1463165 RepID=UPI001FCAF5ED|nr:ead/Ea22-like family protein [Klebsiella quasipneumoniae]MCJ4908238.1 ead/Ea22-like family protein [Klebsiella quasipneumoniae]MDZ0892647.1 ead/Ea22-like family protein [Klebsiella quasipneumoniae]